MTVINGVYAAETKREWAPPWGAMRYVCDAVTTLFSLYCIVSDGLLGLGLFTLTLAFVHASLHTLVLTCFFPLINGGGGHRIKH